MNSQAEQQLLKNQSEMLGGIGRLEKGQEETERRLNKLENRWPALIGSCGGIAGVATLVSMLVGWW